MKKQPIFRSIDAIVWQLGGDHQKIAIWMNEYVHHDPPLADEQVYAAVGNIFRAAMSQLMQARDGEDTHPPEEPSRVSEWFNGAGVAR